MTEILKTIQLIRESFIDAEHIYTHGSCVRFAIILKHLYPDGDILYDSNHALFEYRGTCYDINGIAKKSEHHIPLLQYGILQLYDILQLTA